MELRLLAIRKARASVQLPIDLEWGSAKLALKCWNLSDELRDLRPCLSPLHASVGNGAFDLQSLARVGLGKGVESYSGVN